MQFNNLLSGQLIKRYKRFLADIQLDTGELITAHCPNSGSMKGCSTPGSTVLVSISDNPKRKLKFTWEMIRINGVWIGINTSRTNKIAAAAIHSGMIPEFSEYHSLKAEVPFGEKSRVDFVLEKNTKKIYIEVKNVSLVENGIARFPDSITTRGQKHLRELMNMIRRGHGAAMVYIIQRNDAHHFEPAWNIDPSYAELLTQAHQAGVQIFPLLYEVGPNAIRFIKRLPWTLKRT